MTEAGHCRLGDVMALARQILVQAEVAEPSLDARLIVEHVTGTSRSQAAGYPETPVAIREVDGVKRALARRAAGEPVHRILGYREFYGLKLALSPATLEPRPDTETLVDAMLPLVVEVVNRKGKCAILDLGTGTGAIALALISQVAAAHATGVDISGDALTVALGNARSLGLADRFVAVRSDWFEEIFSRYDVIVSNPPYIVTREIQALGVEVRDHDPRGALDGGEDGLDAYRKIAAGSSEHLAQNGFLGVEIGRGQGLPVVGLFQDAGFRLAGSRNDLARHERALIFRHAG